MRSGDFMKTAAIVVVIILLAAILFERVSARREEAHRRQGETELIRVNKICEYAARGAVADASIGNDKKYLATMRPIQIKLDTSCDSQISDWTAAYPELAQELQLAGRSLRKRVGVMPDGKTRCAIATDEGCAAGN
jgi:hypothetical protein